MKWMDGHCHLQDFRCEAYLKDWLPECEQSGITGFVLGGVDPKDWQRQKQFRKEFPNLKTYLSFGLHPYFVASNNRNDCELALDQLSREIGLADALGETGLDFRKMHIEGKEQSSGELKAQQIDCFENQLELASVAHKPVILHIVQAYEEAITCLKYFPSRGMVHSFSGQLHEMKELLEMGYFISMSGSFMQKKRIHQRNRVHELLKHIPLERLIIETDSPDQSPYWEKSDEMQLNEPINLISIARHIADVLGCTSEEILAKSTENIQTLFGNKI